eukprot:11176813-Lingulodinium_polyedra.AAC.1
MALEMLRCRDETLEEGIKRSGTGRARSAPAQTYLFRGRGSRGHADLGHDQKFAGPFRRFLRGCYS